MFDFINAILSKIATAVMVVLMFFGISDVSIETQTQEKIPQKETTIILDHNFNSDLIEKISTSTTSTKEEIFEQKGNILPAEDKTKKPSSEIIEPIPESVREIIPPSVLNEIVRPSVVNIFCLSKRGGFLEPITGSGIIIDEKGVILTNAHVAQYLLLKNYPFDNNIECLVRIGSPAVPAYKTNLLYISDKWVEENSDNIIRQNIFSTGENDFALLYITETSNPKNTLPESFPSLTPFPTEKIIEKNDPILVASYPAGFLSGDIISRGLWLTSSVSSIKDLFTFSEGPLTPLDLISIGGVIGAQEGSSGGAIVSLYDGRLLGVIVTRTEGETTDDRDLRALSMRHINSQIIEETGGTFEDLLSGNLKDKLARYASTTIPALTQKLIDGLTP